MSEKLDWTEASAHIFAAKLVDLLIESGLVSAEEIDQAWSALPNADEDALVRHLTESGRLTDYQIKLVRERRFTELVIGNYEILDRLGAGGMGAVFKARHRRMKRTVALKILSSKLADDKNFVKRFQREVETIARLSHPNIVMAFDADVSDAGHYLVMEYVNGHDLDFLVKRDGPLTLSAAIDGIMQAARGLEYAHSQGIIHRDIKPANLLRDEQGVVKVTDLGLARFRQSDSGLGGITQAGGVMGTADYMSPEQAMDSTQVDQRTDIYSLGATLYYLLTGQPPYHAESIMGILMKHRVASIPSLLQARADVPIVLDDIFHRMMEKAPADRHQTVTEVLQALTAVAADLGDTAREPGHVALTHRAAAVPSLSPSFDIKLQPESKNLAQAQTIVHIKPARQRRSAAKVVLVEPSRAQSGIIRKYLNGQGIEDVVAVASGSDALDAVRTDMPDAIICTLHLPDMTGVQLSQRVKSENPTAAPGFVLISSETESSEAGTLSKYGSGIVLRKPFTPTQLSDALDLVTNQSAGPGREPATDRGKLRVLIVDDSAPARLHIRNVLKGLDLEQFVEAVDGAQAVAELVKSNFDLVVTDYNMPFMDGGGLVGYLKQNSTTASVPIIMVTTEKDPAKLDVVRRLGVTVCDKSFPSDVVRGILDRIVRTA